MGQVEQLLIGRLVKANIDPSAMDMGKEHYASGNMLKKDVVIRQGVDRETAKKIVKSIKRGQIQSSTSSYG